MEKHLFEANELRALLAELGERIAKRGERVEAYIIGGTAMAIGLGSRRGTEDVDGPFRPYKVVAEEAAKMATELGLRSDWLNTRASSFLSVPSDDTDAKEITFTGMTVRLASPKFLLAMKDGRRTPKRPRRHRHTDPSPRAQRPRADRRHHLRDRR